MSQLQGTASAAQAISRVNYSHDAMIDLILMNPGITQNDIAKHFGYTAPWVSRIRNSDAFLTRLAERKGELVDPTIIANFDDKLKALADQSLEIVAAKLAVTQNPDTALKVLDMTTKALGYGARERNLNVQQNFVVQMPTKVENAGEWAQKHRPMPPPSLVANGGVVDAEVLESRGGSLADATEVFLAHAASQEV